MYKMPFLLQNDDDTICCVCVCEYTNVAKKSSISYNVSIVFKHL